ncbi:DUF3102 domain-containing protein [Pleurocapsales cyanobacterium LEGE 06147]|nr:DUF3102 domain-containing protein [Pleurocapsales cyanobacterium LEGE 06147]
MDNLEKPLKPTTNFNYQALDSEQRNLIAQRTTEIRERLKRSAQDIWEIGQKLVEVRSQLKHGQFEVWLKAEFGWSRRTAYNFINVYEAFNQSANFAQIEIATSALYLLAAPSTPQEVRDKFLQRAKEGEKLTHKELSRVIKEEKRNSSVTVEQPELNEASTSKQEIITIIPKTVVETAKSAPGLLSNSSEVVSDADEIPSGWYLLEKRHLIFCGDTASKKFAECVNSAALAIAITAADWDHDWLIDRVKTVLVFPESALKEQMLEQLIEMFSQPKELIVLPWLPDKAMLATSHQLDRTIIAGDLNLQRCREAIACSGLSREFLGR